MPVVGDLDLDALPSLLDSDLDIPVIHRGPPVPHGVFHHRLEDQGRQIGHGQGLGQVPLHAECVLKPRLHQGQEIAHIGQLLLQRDKGLIDAQRLAEIVGQDEDHLLGLLRVGCTQGGDGTQGVKQKMGVDLGLESPQLGLLAHLNLVLELTHLQHGGKQPGQALRRAAVGLQNQVGPLRNAEQQRPDPLLPAGEGAAMKARFR